MKFSFLSVTLFSVSSKFGVVAFRTQSIHVMSPLSQNIAAAGTISQPSLMLLSLSSSSNEENSKLKSRKEKAIAKTMIDAVFLLKELDEKIDSYEGRLPSKLVSSIDDDDNDHVSMKHDVRKSLHQQHRCGFVGIVGAPNMGKSTLLNALLKEDLCITTRRPQTTRHAILGVMSSPTRQCCLLDTPGVIEGEGFYKLQANMMEAVKGAIKDSDVFVVVTDMFSTPIPNDDIFRGLTQSQKPVIVVVNKIDLEGRGQRPPETSKMQQSDNKIDEEEENEKTFSVAEAVAKWRMLLPSALAIIPMAAAPKPLLTSESSKFAIGEHPGISLLRQMLIGSGNDEEEDIAALVRALGRPVQGMFRSGIKCLTNDDTRNLLPIGPPLYDDEYLSDRSVRFFCSELIREVLLESRYLKKELPYCCEVQITKYREPRDSDEITLIEAVIFVERNSQKAIVVGKNGDVIKQVGIIARRKIERFLDVEKVFLKLQVKVDKDWRKKDDALAKFGYAN